MDSQTLRRDSEDSVRRRPVALPLLDTTLSSITKQQPINNNNTVQYNSQEDGITPTGTTKLSGVPSAASSNETIKEASTDIKDKDDGSNNTTSIPNIKYSNLKSELIIESTEPNKSGELFNSHVLNTGSTSTISAMGGAIPNGIVPTPTSIVPHLANYHSSYNLAEDAGSTYQNSIYSSNIDPLVMKRANANHIPSATATTTATGANNNTNKAKEDEEFIYHDNISVHTIPYNINSNNNSTFLGNNEYYGLAIGTSNNNGLDHTKLLKRQSISNHKNYENELDFLDAQSIVTTNTNNNNSNSNCPNQYSGKNPMFRPQQQLQHSSQSMSPHLPIHQFSSNSLLSPSTPTESISEPKRNIISQVRRVSQKLFNNNNSANQRVQSVEYNPQNRYGGSADSMQRQHVRPTDHTRNVSLNQIDDYTFDEDDELNEAESFLCRPFRNNNQQQQQTYQDDFVNRLQLPRSSRHTGSLASNQLTREDIFKNYGSVSFKRDYDDDNSSQFYYNSPHDYKSMYYRQNLIMRIFSGFIYFVVISSIILISLRLIVLKNFDNHLTNFKVSTIDRIIVSDELLIFELEATSKNVNFQDVSIWEMDLDVFLLTDSSLLEPSSPSSPSSSASSKSEVTILLGNSTRFVTPLNFKGILNRATGTTLYPSISDIWYDLNHKHELPAGKSRGQVKIVQPGKRYKFNGEYLTGEQWSNILNNEFKLIIRGSLSYQLPLISNNEVISVSSDVDVSPNSPAH